MIRELDDVFGITFDEPPLPNEDDKYKFERLAGLRGVLLLLASTENAYVEAGDVNTNVFTSTRNISTSLVFFVDAIHYTLRWQKSASTALTTPVAGTIHLLLVNSPNVGQPYFSRIIINRSLPVCKRVKLRRGAVPVQHLHGHA